VSDSTRSGHDFETFSIRSGLPYSQLVDLRIWAELKVDHEGLGELAIDYGDTAEGQHLRALISLLASLVERLAVAVGDTSAVAVLHLSLIHI